MAVQTNSIPHRATWERRPRCRGVPGDRRAVTARRRPRRWQRRRWRASSWPRACDQTGQGRRVEECKVARGLRSYLPVEDSRLGLWSGREHDSGYVMEGTSLNRLKETLNSIFHNLAFPLLQSRPRQVVIEVDAILVRLITAKYYLGAPTGTPMLGRRYEGAGRETDFNRREHRTGSGSFPSSDASFKSGT